MTPNQLRFASRLAPIAAIAATTALLAVGGSAAPKHAAQQKTAAEAYKNIRVLKTVPADQLIPIMHNWSQSLGVRCDFCHEVTTTAGGQHEGFDKDVKPQKETARRMVLMAMDLNKRYKVVDGKVRCFTCHHGHAMPENEPPAPEPQR